MTGTERRRGTRGNGAELSGDGGRGRGTEDDEKSRRRTERVTGISTEREKRDLIRKRADCDRSLYDTERTRPQITVRPRSKSHGTFALEGGAVWYILYYADTWKRIRLRKRLGSNWINGSTRGIRSFTLRGLTEDDVSGAHDDVDDPIPFERLDVGL